jgi:hypothetical protein
MIILPMVCHFLPSFLPFFPSFLLVLTSFFQVWEVQALSSQTILSCSSDCRLLRWDFEEQQQQQRTTEVTKCYLDINSFDYHQEIDAIVLAADNELLRLVY